MKCTTKAKKMHSSRFVAHRVDSHRCPVVGVTLSVDVATAAEKVSQRRRLTSGSKRQQVPVHEHHVKSSMMSDMSHKKVRLKLTQADICDCSSCSMQNDTLSKNVSSLLTSPPILPNVQTTSGSECKTVERIVATRESLGTDTHA